MSPDYQYQDEGSGHHHAYLLPAVRQMLEASGAREEKLFDCGCGNGSFGNRLAGEGWNVTGVDPSEDGIRIAQGNYPDIRVETGSTEEDLSARFGTFPVVISLEVVEHCYYPYHFARTFRSLLAEDGVGIILHAAV